MRNKRVGLNGFATLGDETRLKIFLKIIELSTFSFINDDPVIALNTAKHITEVFGLAKSTVSHHIETLKYAGLIFEIRKKKFIYLFPNFTAITDFKTFLDEQILVFQNDGQYECAADLKIDSLSDHEIQTIKDLYIIEGCKNVAETKDQSGNTKIYFKILGFNEPFYAVLGNDSMKIFCIQKNYSAARPVLESLALSIVRSLS
jgi:DNA-binding transcriptional ArsR family regulator